MSSQIKDELARVLIVAGDQRSRNVLTHVVESGEHRAQEADTVLEAEHELARQEYDVVLYDLDDLGSDGLHRLIGLRGPAQSAQFVVLAGTQSLEQAVAATKQGAFGYITRPFDSAALLALVERGRREGLRRRDQETQQQRKLQALRRRIVGRSAAMDRMFELIERVAHTRATVLVVGETGTGKELVAQAIHELSERAPAHFVPVNCSALPETLLESELFGHTRGSFTGAIANRRGLFEEANGGTLFLDEISTISPAIQVKLLRVLQDRKIQRVGGNLPIEADFRLIAATNVDLAEEVMAGRFREDLYYRLNVFPVRVPPLRERREDIPVLVQHFRKKFSEENNVPAPGISAETVARLVAYDWPGNVRELENFMERAVIMYGDRANVPFDPPLGERSGMQRTLLHVARESSWDLARLEREYILDVLESQHGHRAEAAAILGIDRRTLYRKLKEFGTATLSPADATELD